MKSPINFLQGIIVVIVLSIIGLIVLIVFSQSTEFGLVEKDYYNSDLRYQDQIERIERSKALARPVDIEQINNVITITFPNYFKPSEVNGEVQLFRPSDPRLDRTIPIQLDELGSQLINIEGLKNGVWIIKLNWIFNNLEYYKEKRVFLNT